MLEQNVVTQPIGRRPQQLWDAKLEMLCRYKALDKGQTVAGNVVHWDALLPSFLEAALLMGLDTGCQNASILYPPWPQRWLAWEEVLQPERNDLLAGLERLGCLAGSYYCSAVVPFGC